MSAKTDLKIARKSLGEERKAIRDYGNRLKQARNPKVRKAIKHALPEERTHAKLFQEAVQSARH